MAEHRTMQEIMLGDSSRSMADLDLSLVLCNLPSGKSAGDWEPARLSYYNGDELLAVPFKWEAAPGKPIVDELSSQADSGEFPVLQLRPPPSASSSPLHPYVPPSWRDQQKPRLPPKSRSYTSSMSASRSGGGFSTTAADSYSHHLRARSKGSISRRSEFDWPEVSDDELSSSTTRTTDEQEVPSSSRSSAPSSTPSSTARTGSTKHFSFSSSSFSSISTRSQSPPPVNSGGGSRRDLVLLRNVVNAAAAAAASAAAPGNCYVLGPGRRASSADSSDNGEESEEGHGHVRSPGGFFSCLPILSKFRFIQRHLCNKNGPAVINFPKRLNKRGSRNRRYGQSL